MKGKRELWMELCAQAADEQDPEKLMQLVEQINQLLEEKEATPLGTKPTNLRAECRLPPDIRVCAKGLRPVVRGAHHGRKPPRPSANRGLGE